MGNLGGEVGTKNIFLPETLETPGTTHEPTILKTLSILQRRTVTTERWETNEVRPSIAQGHSLIAKVWMDAHHFCKPWMEPSPNIMILLQCGSWQETDSAIAYSTSAE